MAAFYRLAVMSSNFPTHAGLSCSGVGLLLLTAKIKCIAGNI
ncbi:hypothetical protein [Parageobacillus toebii]